MRVPWILLPFLFLKVSSTTTELSRLHQEFLEVAIRDAVSFTTDQPTTTTTTVIPEHLQTTYESPMHKEFLEVAERNKIELNGDEEDRKRMPIVWFLAPEGNMFSCRMEMYKFIHQHCKKACGNRNNEDAAMQQGCQDKGPINSEHIRFICCDGPKPEGVN